MRLIRWSATRRILPSDEVKSGFDDHAHEPLLFAFTTHAMAVGEHDGNFSVKFITSGREQYRFPARSLELSPGHVLITNRGETYSSEIDVPATRAISCFLPNATVREIVASIATPGRLPDDRGACPSVPEFLAVPFRAGDILAGRLAVLSATIAPARTPTLDALEELLLETVGCAIAEALGVVPVSALEGVVRRATREDLLARLLRARHMVLDARRNVTLSQMAAEACLSRYHFLRTFKAAFGETPVAFARRVRLQRGQQRLGRGESSRAASRAAGYRSTSSFLRSLRRRQ